MCCGGSSSSTAPLREAFRSPQLSAEAPIDASTRSISTYGVVTAVDGSQGPRDFQKVLDRMTSMPAFSSSRRRNSGGPGGDVDQPCQSPLPTITSDAQREASLEQLATDYQAALERLQEEAAALGAGAPLPVPANLEQVLDSLRRQQAGLVAELHRRRLERQNQAIQGELETEKLLAQLQQAQLKERHSELRGELERAARGRLDMFGVGGDEDAQTNGVSANTGASSATASPGRCSRLPGRREVSDLGVLDEDVKLHGLSTTIDTPGSVSLLSSPASSRMMAHSLRE